MQLEIELNTNAIARVEFEVIKIDASFDHEFGTRKEIKYDIDNISILSFEKWDDDGEYITSLVPTKEEIIEIEQKTFDSFVNSI